MVEGRLEQKVLAQVNARLASASTGARRAFSHANADPFECKQEPSVSCPENVYYTPFSVNENGPE